VVLAHPGRGLAGPRIGGPWEEVGKGFMPNSEDALDGAPRNTHLPGDALEGVTGMIQVEDAIPEVDHRRGSKALPLGLGAPEPEWVL